MKLRKTLSTLLAAALMCGLLCVPSMAASPTKVTGGSYYHTVELSTALNEGTAMLGVYASTEAARPVRVYTVQTGTVLTVTGDYYIDAHPVTLLPDGTYELKSVVTLATTDGSKRATNDPQYLEQSEGWQSWTWWVPGTAHVSATHSSSVTLNNSMAGTWMLRGGDVVLRVLPVEVSSQDTSISVYQVSNSAGALNIRAGAGTNFAKVGSMANGTQFEVVTATISNGWGQLTSGNWVWLNGARFIRYKGSCGVIGRQNALWTHANTYRIVANSLAIHDGPADGHAVVGTLAKGTLIDVTEYYGEDWGYLANQAGWVRLGSNGNSANVQFAAIKNITTASTAPAGSVQARLEIYAGAGIVEVRQSNSFDSVVIGYLAPQGVSLKLDLVEVWNDWGHLASGGWVYLPNIGALTAGDNFVTAPSV